MASDCPHHFLLSSWSPITLRHLLCPVLVLTHLGPECPHVLFLLAVWDPIPSLKRFLQLEARLGLEHTA